jgi:hypothetical protein
MLYIAIHPYNTWANAQKISLFLTKPKKRRF